ncbi:MAG: T9SS type A sorting domain-containing protein [Bacteroidota bacterium]
MRKLILLLSVVFSVNTIHAQITYFNYLDYTSEWRYYSSGWNGWCCVDTDYTTTYFDGDTTINGQNYYKRFSVTVHNNLAPALSNVSFVREDINGYFLSYSPTSGTETIFFDNQLIANSQIGNAFPYPGATCTVNDIDTVAFDFKQLKHLYGVNTQLYTGSMEGIGVIGLACVTGVEGGGGLSCYTKQGNSLQFGTISCSSFPLPQKTSTVTAVSNHFIDRSITLYPNPASTILTISDKQNLFQAASIYITNALGQTVMSSSFSEQLNISQLPLGVYFLVLENDDTRKAIKFIKE